MSSKLYQAARDIQQVRIRAGDLVAWDPDSPTPLTVHHTVPVARHAAVLRAIVAGALVRSRPEDEAEFQRVEAEFQRVEAEAAGERPTLRLVR